MRENLEQNFNKGLSKPVFSEEDLERFLKEKERLAEEKDKRLEKMAELAVESAFGKGVLEKPDAVEKPEDLGAAAKKKKEKYIPYPYSERKRIEELIKSYKDRLGKARMKESRETYKEKIEYLQGELKKANAAVEKIENAKKQKQKNPTELQSDIGESKPKTYGPDVYAKESSPEDALEEAGRFKNIKKTVK